MGLLRTTTVAAVAAAGGNAALLLLTSRSGLVDSATAAGTGAPVTPAAAATASALAVAASGVARGVLRRLRGPRRGRRAHLTGAAAVFALSAPAPFVGLDGGTLGARLLLLTLHATTVAAAIAAAELGDRPTWSFGTTTYTVRDLPEGAVAVVTGATSGIGRAVALDLARRGLHVLGVGRSESKARSLEAESADLAGHIDVVTADVTAMADADRTGDELQRRVGGRPLTAVVHAMGTLVPRPASSIDGIDVGLTASWLSRIALHRQLRPAPEARIVILGAAESPDVPRRVAPPRTAADFASGMAAHGQAQLGNLVWATALVRRGIRAWHYGPGAVDTDIRRELPAVLRWGVAPAFWWSTRASADAAADVVRLLLDVDLPEGGVASREGVAPQPVVWDHELENGIMQTVDEFLSASTKATAG